MPTMNVRVKSIWLCPKRSLDYALGQPHTTSKGSAMLPFALTSGRGSYESSMYLSA